MLSAVEAAGSAALFQEVFRMLFVVDERRCPAVGASAVLDALLAFQIDICQDVVLPLQDLQDFGFAQAFHVLDSARIQRVVWNRNRSEKAECRFP